MNTHNRYGAACSDWTLLHPQANIDILGYIPKFFDDYDPRPAEEQLEDAYPMWSQATGMSLDDKGFLCYPGDPPLLPVAMRKLRDEEIILFLHSWLVIMQPDGTYVCGRVD